MMGVLGLLAAALTMFWAIYIGFGYETAYRIGYGAFSLLAAMISATFFWLWRRRATPLALGMGFGWAGAASVMGWWWLYHLMGRPGEMEAHPFLFALLSIYFVGAVMHFAVIGRSFGWGRNGYLVPVFCAALASGMVHLLS